MRIAAPLLVLLTLAACGRAESPSEPDPEAWIDGIPGTYAMDARRTVGQTVKDAQGRDVPVSEADMARVQASVGADGMRLILEADQTFSLVVGAGDDRFTTGGTWTETPGGISVVTTTVNGEPAPEEVRSVTETYAIERGYVIGEGGGGQRFYLKKQKPE